MQLIILFSFQRPTTVTTMERSCAFLAGLMSQPCAQFQSVRSMEGTVSMETVQSHSPVIVKWDGECALAIFTCFDTRSQMTLAAS